MSDAALDERPSPRRAKALGAALLASMPARLRHLRGAHYTAEADVLRAIEPALLRPLRERIAAARTAELGALHDELASLRVLDPACGAGDFLRVALRELLALERAVLHRLGAPPRVGPHQLSGIDVDPAAVAVTRAVLGLTGDLADRVRCADALFCDWPRADVIIGNPPFLAKNKMQAELGAAYVRRVRARYAEVPGRADYCVYWFRRAHDELPPGGRAALVGTNTIRQNDSRRGGLDYIVARGGTITEAVSTQVWPGDAVVHVSIVSWVKGPAPGSKRIFTQLGDRAGGPWAVEVVDRIQPALSAAIDVTRARVLRANRAARACHQGQTPGHDAFLLDPAEARALVEACPASREVLFPFLTGDDLLSRPGGAPSRFVADLQGLDRAAAEEHRALFARLEALVRPAREEAARRERERGDELSRRDPRARANTHHATFLARWWQLGYGRADLVARLAGLERYVACSRVSKRPIFELVDARVRPSDALTVFTLSDDWSFGVLQSDLHAAWLRARCSTMKGDARYTSSTVFDTFPWPQAPAPAGVRAVTEAARSLRTERRRIAGAARGLREVYAEGDPALLRAHAALDASVRAAHGMREGEDALAFLMAENERLAAREDAGERIGGPGLPG